MKNLLLISIVVFFIFTSSTAQNIKYGSKIGVNFANITGDETDDLNTKTFLHAGAVAEIIISDEFSFQGELLYSAQGAKSDYSETIDQVTFFYTSVNLEYINVPLLAKYYIVEGLSLEVGPQVGFLLTANREFEKTDNGEIETGEEDILDEIKGMDFGLNFGLAYKVGGGIFLAARYNLGLSNINDVEGSDDLKNQNRVVQVSAGYFF
jgi:hypothetical protein